MYLRNNPKEKMKCACCSTTKRINNLTSNHNLSVVWKCDNCLAKSIWDSKAQKLEQDRKFWDKFSELLEVE